MSSLPTAAIGNISLSSAGRFRRVPPLGKQSLLSPPSPALSLPSVAVIGIGGGGVISTVSFGFRSFLCPAVAAAVPVNATIAPDEARCFAGSWWGLGDAAGGRSCGGGGGGGGGSGGGSSSCSSSGSSSSPIHSIVASPAATAFASAAVVVFGRTPAGVRGWCHREGMAARDAARGGPRSRTLRGLSPPGVPPIGPSTAAATAPRVVVGAAAASVARSGLSSSSRQPYPAGRSGPLAAPSAAAARRGARAAAAAAATSTSTSAAALARETMVVGGYHVGEGSLLLSRLAAVSIASRSTPRAPGSPDLGRGRSRPSGGVTTHPLRPAATPFPCAASLEGRGAAESEIPPCPPLAARFRAAPGLALVGELVGAALQHLGGGPGEDGRRGARVVCKGIG